MDGIEDRFPEGLRVLVVDDNLSCLRILELLLQRCKYKVTGTQEATEALKMLAENPKKYDIVISDVHMPVMDGFQLLENIGLHMDIPVIMLSANDDYAQVMKGIKQGAVDFLIKPVRTEVLKNIWQHVIRRKSQNKTKGKTIAYEKEEARAMSTNQGPKAKPKTQNKNDKDGPKIDNHDPFDSKRQRVIWSPYLHKKFVRAFDQLGPKNALPKKILDIMNVEGLTRENVASHLLKYKIYLKRMTIGQPVYPTLTPFGAHDSSLFWLGGAMFNPYGPFTNLESSISNSSIGLTLPSQHSTTNGTILEQMITSTSNPGGYIAKIPSVKQFQMNSSHGTTSGPSTQGVGGLPNQPSLPAQYSGYMTQYGIPNPLDHTKCMENRQNNNVIHETVQQDQANPTIISGWVHSTEISNFQNALCTSSSRYPLPPIVQSTRFNTVGLQGYGGELTNVVSTSNDGDQLNQQFGETSSNPYETFATPTYGHIAEINTSSGLQNIQAQASELDALLNMDEDYLHDEHDLFAGLHENDDDPLRDIMERLLD